MENASDKIRNNLKNIKRVVLKVGTKLLVDSSSGVANENIKNIVQYCCHLRAHGKEVVLVSSGAIGAGKQRLGLLDLKGDLSLSQMAASVGQGILMEMYSSQFNEKSITVGQVLLTHADLKDEQRRLNAKNTFMSLLQFGVIPIVNENDVVSTEEIKFGDNDVLASMVADLVAADLLILLTSVDGLLKDNIVVEYLPELTDEHRNLIEDDVRNVSFGGMGSKLESAANFAKESRVCIIANGKDPKVIEKILAGEKVGTLIAKKTA